MRSRVNAPGNQRAAIASGGVSLAVVLLASAGYGQKPCGSANRPRVEVSGASADVARVATLLRAELAPRSIDVCVAGEGTGPASIASVTVSARPDGALVEVEVRDSLTAKRVSRDVDLAAVPEDGRSLTVALVADELLRASWAEIALRGAPPPARPIPPAVSETVHGDLPGPRSAGGLALRWEAVAAAEAWAGSLALYGVDVRVAVAMPSGLGATARVGIREGPSVSAQDGQIQASALLGGIGLSLRTVPPWHRYGLDAVVRVDAARIAFGATPSAGASGGSQSDATVLVGAGVDGWAALGGSVSLMAEALIDTPLRPVAADDAGRSVVAASGAGIEGGVGIRVAF
jgi:hypothetical protein